MKKHEIPLNFTETSDESISEICQCEFCDRPIRFYRYKGWIGDDYSIQNVDETFHRCRARSTAWTDAEIPEGWEYWKSDDDDDRACFMQKKHTRFLPGK